MEDKKKELKIYINANTEQQFRKLAMQRYGYARGSISQAAENALQHWNACASISQIDVSDIKDPIKAIEGMLAHVKKSSVEVQHEIPKIRAQQIEKELEDIRKRRKR